MQNVYYLVAVDMLLPHYLLRATPAARKNILDESRSIYPETLALSNASCFNLGCGPHLNSIDMCVALRASRVLQGARVPTVVGENGQRLGTHV